MFAGLVTTLRLKHLWVVFDAFALFGGATAILGLVLARRASRELAEVE